MQVFQQKLGGPTVYNIYVPDNVNPDTEVLFYTINKSLDQEMKQDIANYNGDSIIIVPENSPIVVGSENSYHKFQDEAIEAFNLVKDKYNLQTDQFSQAGFSSGYGPSIRTLADYIKQNPDAGRQVLISADGCRSTNGFTVYDSEYQALKDNNTIIISYSQKYRQPSEINFLEKTGLPILFVVDPDIPEDSSSRWGYYHDVIANNFTERGLYESLLKFANGEGELPEGYTYQLYDPVSKQIKTINAYDAASYLGIIPSIEQKLQKLTSLSTISLENLAIKSDSAILSQPLNQIISKIKNSSYLQSSNAITSSFSSTTQMPSKVPEIVKEHFMATIDLLYKIANDVSQFAKIGPLIDKIDRELANEAVQALQLQQNTVSTQPNLNQLSEESNNNKENNKGTQSTVVLDNGTVFTNATPPVTIGAALKNAIKDKDKSNIPNTYNQDNETNGGSVNSDSNSENNEGNIQNNQQTDNSESVITPPENQNNNQDNIVTPPSSNKRPVVPNNPSNNQQIPEQNINNDEIHPLEQFPKYEEVYSDDKKIVYSSNEGYKIIVHKEGNEIIGIEHYYDFKSEESANLALENLKSEYMNDGNVENIMQKGSYVKVVFKEEMYENLTIQEVKEKYSNYNEIVKETNY